MGLCGGQTEDERTAPYLLRPDYVLHRLQQSLTRGELWGSPGTDGTIKSNIIDNLKGDHSILGICFAHELHPFSKRERLIFLFSSLCWLLMIQAAFFSGGGGMDPFGEGIIVALLVWPWKKFVRVMMECACFYDTKYDPEGMKNLNDTDFDIQDAKKVALGCIECLGSVVTCSNVVWSIIFLIIAIVLITESPNGQSFAGEWAYSQCMSLFVTETFTIIVFTYLAGTNIPLISNPCEKEKFVTKWTEQDPYWSAENVPESYSQVGALAKWNFILIDENGGQEKFDKWFPNYDSIFSITDEVNGFYKDLKEKERATKTEEGGVSAEKINPEVNLK